MTTAVERAAARKAEKARRAAMIARVGMSNAHGLRASSSRFLTAAGENRRRLMSGDRFAAMQNRDGGVFRAIRHDLAMARQYRESEAEHAGRASLKTTVDDVRAPVAVYRDHNGNGFTLEHGEQTHVLAVQSINALAFAVNKASGDYVLRSEVGGYIVEGFVGALPNVQAVVKRFGYRLETPRDTYYRRRFWSRNDASRSGCTAIHY